MNGLLNMVNDSHSNPRLIESDSPYIRVRERPQSNALRQKPTIHIMFLIQIHSCCDVESACDAIRS